MSHNPRYVKLRYGSKMHIAHATVQRHANFTGSHTELQSVSRLPVTERGNYVAAARSWET